MIRASTQSTHKMFVRMNILKMLFVRTPGIAEGRSCCNAGGGKYALRSVRTSYECSHKR